MAEYKVVEDERTGEVWLEEDVDDEDESDPFWLSELDDDIDEYYWNEFSYRRFEKTDRWNTEPMEEEFSGAMNEYLFI